MGKSINIFGSSDTENIKKAQEVYKKYLDSKSGAKIIISDEKPKEKNCYWFNTSGYNNS